MKLAQTLGTWLFAFAFFTFATPAAHAMRLRPSIIGNVNYPLSSNGVINGSTAVDSKASYGYGAGLGFELVMAHMIGLEVDGLYVIRRYRSALGGTPTEVPSAHVPVGLRIHFIPFVSLLAGGYWDKSLKSGSTGTDYGATFGMRFNFMPFTGLFVEPRYNMELKAPATGVEKARELEILVGWAF